MTRAKMTEEQKVIAANLRKLKKENERREAEEKVAKASAAWEFVKREKWYESLLRVQGLLDEVFDEYGNYADRMLKDKYDWFFDDFAVNVNYSNLENSSMHYNRGVATNIKLFTSVHYQDLCADFEDAKQYMQEVVDIRESERKKAEELANKRSQALSKLTVEERKLLGLQE